MSKHISVFNKSESFCEVSKNIKVNYRLYVGNYLNHFLDNLDYLSAQAKFSDVYLKKKELDELSILYTLKHRELQKKYGVDEEVLDKKLYPVNTLEFEIARLLRSKTVLYFENLYCFAKDVFSYFSCEFSLKTMQEAFNAIKFLSYFNIYVIEENNTNKASIIYGSKQSSKNEVANTSTVTRRNKTRFLFSVSKKYFDKKYQVSVNFEIPKEFSEIFDKKAFELFCQFLISNEDEDMSEAFSPSVAEGMFLNILLGEKIPSDSFLNILFLAKSLSLNMFNPDSLKGLTTRDKLIELLNFYAFYSLTQSLKNWIENIDLQLKSKSTISANKPNKEQVCISDEVLKLVGKNIDFCQEVFNKYAFLYFVSANPYSDDIKPLFEKFKVGDKEFDVNKVGDAIELSYDSLKICNITVVKTNKLSDFLSLRQQQVDTLLKLKKVEEAYQKNGLDAGEAINKLSSLLLTNQVEEARKLSSLIEDRDFISSSSEALTVCVDFY